VDRSNKIYLEVEHGFVVLFIIGVLDVVLPDFRIGEDGNAEEAQK